jgi:cell division protein FtsB
MRDPFLMVVLIVLIVTIGNIYRSKLRRDRRSEAATIGDDRENAKLRDEVKQLKDRIAVLERITVEKENSLERQIEELRDR